MSNIQDNPLASYKLFEAALGQKGYAMHLEGEGDDAVAFFTSPSGKVWRTAIRQMTYPFVSPSTREIALKKDESYELAKRTGVSIPYTFQVHETTTDDELTRLLARFGHLIVKPSDSLQSRGLTLGITTLTELKRAIEHARQVSKSVLIQQQVNGEEVRFTIVNSEVVSSLLRETARVIGDGISTIQQLIAKENERRQKLHFEYVAYPQLDITNVDPAFINSTDVPRQGEVIKLNHSSMVRGGCSIYDVLPRVNKSYIEIATRLAQALGVEFLIVDILCEDFTQPATSQNYNFIEFNTAPALKLYYACRDGKHFDIVSCLADAIDRKIQGSVID